MIWIILTVSGIATFLWILFGPVMISMDSDNNKYSIILPGIFKSTLVPDEEIFHIKGWIFFIPFTVYPFHKKAPRNTTPKRASGRKLKFNVTMGKEALRAFRLKRFYLDIDTDDFIINSQLIPLFTAFNSDHIQMKVNFQGNASLLLDLRTRVGRLIWTLIKHKNK